MNFFNAIVLFWILKELKKVSIKINGLYLPFSVEYIMTRNFKIWYHMAKTYRCLNIQ